MPDMRKVVSGESIAGENYTAATHNRFIDATVWAEAKRASGGRLPSIDFRLDGIGRIKNDTGNNLPRFSVVGIQEPLYSPRTKEDAFRQEYTLLGVTPETPTHNCKFAILAEPIPDGEIGFAWLDGIAPALLDPSTVDEAVRADIIDGETSQLGGGDSGVKIIWLDDTDDNYDRWALVHLGTCGDPNNSIPNGKCLCCPGCVCWPDGEGDTTAGCDDIPCLLTIYNISGHFPWSANEGPMAYDSACDFSGDTFNITICPGTEGEDDLGDHHWELTVAAGIHGAEVRLVGDTLNLTYVANMFFHPVCGTEFVLDTSDLCGVPTKLIHLIPQKICVTPGVGSAGCDICGASTEPIQTDCCPEPIPRNLRVAFHNGPTDMGNCDGLDGDYIDITYIGPTPHHHWRGTGTVCGETMGFYMRCVPGALQFNTSETDCFDGDHSGPLDGDGSGTDGWGTLDPVTCDPFSAGPVTYPVKVGCACCTQPAQGGFTITPI